MAPDAGECPAIQFGNPWQLVSSHRANTHAGPGAASRLLALPLEKDDGIGELESGVDQKGDKPCFDRNGSRGIGTCSEHASSRLRPQDLPSPTRNPARTYREHAQPGDLRGVHRACKQGCRLLIAEKHQEGFKAEEIERGGPLHMLMPPLGGHQELSHKLAILHSNLANPIVGSEGHRPTPSVRARVRIVPGT
jgi:hypothetical protein